MIIDLCELLPAVANACKIVHKKSTIPILSCLALVPRADTGQPELVATDLDLELRVQLKAENPNTHGRALVIPAHTLHAALKGVRKAARVAFTVLEPALEHINGDEHRETQRGALGRVKIDADDGSLSVILPLHHVADFPDFPLMRGREPSGQATIAAPALAGALGAVRFAVSNEETRYYLKGAYLHLRKWRGSERLCLAATDGHRLAMKALADDEIGAGWAAFADAIIPAFAMDALARHIGRDDGTIGVTWFPMIENGKEMRGTVGRLDIAGNNWVLKTKVIDGTYPDYQRTIPRCNSKAATMPVKALGDAAKQALSVLTAAGGSSRAIRFDLERSKPCTIVANSGDNQGAFKRGVPCAYAADEMSVGFNLRYVVDFCRVVKGPDVTFTFEDAGSPVLVADSADRDWLGVLMPMRV